MPTPILVGTEIKEIDVLEMLPPQEGEINITYGRIGTGKTSIGTRRIIKQLKHGIVVYANWRIKFDGFDERTSKWLLFLGILGLKREYRIFPKENFHYFPIGTDFIEKLSVLTSCSVHLDEGHIPFDSYEATRMDVKKRSAVFATRHYDRSMYIYTQRANSVHVNLRGNSNRFYKCEKTFDKTFFRKRFIHFLVTEFQDLTPAGTVDETRIIDKEGRETNQYKHAVSDERYWSSQTLFDLYDSKYLRGDMPESQKNLARFFTLSFREKINSLFQRDV